MDFNNVVQYYERIGATKKRLEIIDILAQLFQECRTTDDGEDFPKIIYLTQGRLVSEITEWPKFGVAEKMIIQAMVKLTSSESSQIKKAINKTGDVGEVVQNILKKERSKRVKYSLDSAFKTGETKKKKTFQIEALYKDLEKLSLLKGDGSQENKIDLINGILRRCTPQSAKYVVNIILSNLRIGLADMTIMDSLAIVFLGDKSKRHLIEKVYNIFPDLGFIVKKLLDKGEKGLQEIGIQVGVPIRMMLASRIQYPQIQAKLGGGDFIAEYKYDGERVQVHKHGNEVKLFSRHLKDISLQYPDVIRAVRDEIKAYEVIFEGEIVAMDPFFEKMLPFQVVSTRRRKYDIEKMIKEVPVSLFCFDILYFRPDETHSIEKSTTMFLPLMERRKMLESLFTPSDHLQLSQMKMIHSSEMMVDYFNEARAKGAEGIMNKKIGEDAIYKAGNRGFLWIKLKGLEGAKMVDTIDVVIIGGSWGKGRRKGILSPLFGAVYNSDSNKFEFLTRIGSGFTDDDLIQFTEKLREFEVPKCPKNVICSDVPDMWVDPKLIIEVMGDELTISNKADAGATPTNSSGYGLRFPVYQRTRNDKDIYQITTTAEIISFYEMQNG
ncbi:ATP-dependent DNA ligase [Candidatus Lokiarchaeum ossiferum]|uniref:ATP-dependent DNA ligase n=1 Tax=Candidatus Lokiarchaeum ossiferum TaxID=2951803 RepID=UPI00352D6EC4